MLTKQNSSVIQFSGHQENREKMEKFFDTSDKSSKKIEKKRQLFDTSDKSSKKIEKKSTTFLTRLTKVADIADT